MTLAAYHPARMLIDQMYFGTIQALPMLAPLMGRAVAIGGMAAVPFWRRTLRENARLALGPQAAEAEVRAVATEMLLNMQRSIAEILLSEGVTVDALAARVSRFSGQEQYHAARDRGRGLVVASAHMGAFEPSIALLRKFESRIHVLFHPDPLPRFERARSALRQSLGIIEHAVSDGVSAWAALQDALRANEVVVLHADRVMPMQQGSRIPFLGAHDTMLPTGAARLALACGAPIVPTFCYRHGHELEVEMMAPIYCEVESLRSSEVASHPAQLALVAALETAIRKHPSQWMAFMQVREARK